MSLRNISMIPTLLGKLPQIIDITDQLPRKKTWSELEKQLIVEGKTQYKDGKPIYVTGLRKPEDIHTIVIHHSGSPEASMESHARYHSGKWGAGIAYHIVIDNNQIYQTNDLLDFTFHVGGHNTYTVGICVNRDLSKKDLTERERELLYGAIMSVQNVLNIIHIKGHNELNPTVCPATSMTRIRQDVASLAEKINFDESPANKAAIYFQVKERYHDLYEKFINADRKWSPAIQQEAGRKLDILYSTLSEKGWLP